MKRLLAPLLVTMSLLATACDDVDDPELQHLIREAELEEAFEIELAAHVDPTSVDAEEHERALEIYIAARSVTVTLDDPTNPVLEPSESDPQWPALCIDPAEVDRVWYLSTDPSACSEISIHCHPKWRSVRPECGCGCMR